MYDEPALRDVAQAAQVVVTAHRDGRCGRCTSVGCPELVWAAPVVAAWESRWLAAAVEAGGQGVDVAAPRRP